MEKIIEYKLVGGRNPQHLAEAVNQLIGEGFEPFGNVFQQGNVIFAANGKEGAGRNAARVSLKSHRRLSLSQRRAPFASPLVGLATAVGCARDRLVLFRLRQCECRATPANRTTTLRYRRACRGQHYCTP
jgi:hypothetical protein